MATTAQPTTPAGLAGAPAGPPIEIPDFDIVPRLGLVPVAVVFAALVAAIAANKLWPLTSSTSRSAPPGRSSTSSSGFVLGPILGKLSVPAGSS